MTPSATSVPTSAFSVSLIVPSPENTTNQVEQVATASRASSVA